MQHKTRDLLPAPAAVVVSYLGILCFVASAPSLIAIKKELPLAKDANLRHTVIMSVLYNYGIKSHYPARPTYISFMAVRLG